MQKYKENKCFLYIFILRKLFYILHKMFVSQSQSLKYKENKCFYILRKLLFTFFIKCMLVKVFNY